MQTQAFNIVLPKVLVSKIDRAAKNEYKNRSELIREAVRIYLSDRLEWEKLLAYGKKKGKKMGIKSEEDVNRIVREYRHGR
ncbi:MAG: ribbon-helix-helix protein, CopG family [Candidatus Blackburnbacteria bacterium]|nr:ribbon-helix-helix protein, CopG family [Candidatus Blackburnbacteria bacterium]